MKTPIPTYVTLFSEINHFQLQLFSYYSHYQSIVFFLDLSIVSPSRHKVNLLKGIETVHLS